MSKDHMMPIDRPSKVRTMLSAVALAALCATAALIGTVAARPFGAWMEQEWYSLKVRRALAARWEVLASTGSQLGSAASPVAVVEFSDYECPFCRRSDATLDSVLPGTTILVSYHHLPLSQLHPAAYDAARAAICAEQQNRFKAMHHLLMTTEAWQIDRDWWAAAKVAGVRDQARFIACLGDASTANRINRDREMAAALGVTGTPAFFTKTRALRGALGVREMVLSVDSATRRAKRQSTNPAR
jgi:protein-disulfide isomerase